ncbi:MAG: 2-dehydropantoate 2-reductase [Lachnospiraceae bacterium]|nr:2-dehydropantoate 2-reductase [Lachnospiraceae bacterium]
MDKGLKYLIVGTGGTGGAVGAYMARAGFDVSFIARGGHLKAIKDKGLRVIRPNDEFTVNPVKAYDADSYEEKPDVIFVCVKGYSVEGILPLLKRISDENTVIIPILNIFGTGGSLAKHFSGPLVTDGCIYVASQIEAPGCIRMNGDILRVVFGVRKKEEYREILKDIENDLKESGIDGILSDNIARDALLKFSYVSPQGACGLFYDVPAGGIQKPGEIRDCFITLIKEIDALADAMDIHFEEDIVSRNLNILDALSEKTTTSLQRDVAAGRDSEIDGLIYEVVRLGNEYGVPVPEYEKIASELKKRQQG